MRLDEILSERSDLKRSRAELSASLGSCAQTVRR
jgi:hypothetical protein